MVEGAASRICSRDALRVAHIRKLGQLNTTQALRTQLGHAGNLKGFQRYACRPLEQQVRQLGVACQRRAVHVGSNDRPLNGSVVSDLSGFASLRRPITHARDDTPEGSRVGTKNGSTAVVLEAAQRLGESINKR